MKGSVVLATVLGAPVVAYFLGVYFGRLLRMRDHGWRIGLVLASLAMGTAVTYFFWPPKLGIDLSGGVILVYEVDEEASAPATAAERTAAEAPGADAQAATRADQVDMAALVQALQRRINPTGVREVVIREYGANQVEIIIPQVTESEIDDIKRRIVHSGYLTFQILANEQDHARVIELARQMNESANPYVRARGRSARGTEWSPSGFPLRSRRKRVRTSPHATRSRSTIASPAKWTAGARP